MLLEAVSIDPRVKELLRKKGIERLNPPQELAVKAGILEGKSVVVSSPTASGKTLIAELAILRNCLKGKKSVYIAPLRALASEKYDDFQYSELGLRTALSTGDLDSNDSWLSRFDVIVLTAEKMDSLMRHSPEWLNDIGLVVIDEIHLLNDAGRGPTLEIIITRLLDTGCQILGLSATIANASAISDWLNAELVTSSYRPVKLSEGVFNGKKVVFNNKNGFELKGDETSLVKNTLDVRKQVLVFSSTRKTAESGAEKASLVTREHANREELSKVSKKILGSVGKPTEQCKRLARLVEQGAAFHHAGLVNEQRKAIEEAFRKDLIKAIVATPTLAAGVNLPAYRVIITSLKRFDGYGSSYIPVLEYKQMAGRAGRPKYDKEGEAIVVSGNADEIMERFVNGKEEDITSKLAAEPILRTHILALIATETVRDETTLMDFLSKTFFAFQYGDIYRLEERVLRVVDRLEEQGFVKGQAGLKPTLVGKRVSQLYIDPETAHRFIESMKEKKINPFGMLALISSSKEMGQISVGRREEDKYNEVLVQREDELLYVPEYGSLEYDELLPAVKGALILESWISERGEDEILQDFAVTPGMLRGKVEIADWLLYACQEIGTLMKHPELSEIRKVRERVVNGIKEELIPLIRLKGIGRVRARRLFSSGFQSLNDLRKAPLRRLEQIIGRDTAQSVKEQVGGADNTVLEQSGEGQRYNNVNDE